ncbi:MAG: aldehyde dehydrogenase family protein, partial [Trebonia sp.]
VPALLAGCAVLLKPSELTPLFVEPLAASIAAVPELAGVLRIVTGGPETGRAVIEQVDAVCFTGSVRTGREVARQAADRFIPAFLELGGKDPAIVCASADLDVATSALLWGSTANAGQSCMSIERVYVAREVARRFTELLVEKADLVTLDRAGDGSGQVSRFIDPRQAVVVTEHLADAVARGATVRSGGEVEGTADGALFLPPTVVTGVDHTMRIMTEETFGPVIPVMAVESAAQAVEYANSTSYGLSAAVFGGQDEALQIARQLEAGGISVNDVCLTGMVPVGEKQAFKLSGLGPSRMGPASVARFVRRRIALVREEPRRQPWWYDGQAAS